MICREVEDDTPYRCDFCPLARNPGQGQSFQHLKQFQDHLQSDNHSTRLKRIFPDPYHLKYRAIQSITWNTMHTKECCCTKCAPTITSFVRNSPWFHPSDETNVRPSIPMIPKQKGTSSRESSCLIIMDTKEDVEKKIPNCFICQERPRTILFHPCK